MKKIAFLFAAGLMILAACTKTDESKGLRTFTIRAELPADVRAAYAADGKFSWEAGDVIDVLFNNNGYSFYQLTTTESGKSVSFSGEVSGEEGGNFDYLAVYPSGLLGGIWPGDGHEGFSVNMPSVVNGSGADQIPMIARVSKASGSTTYQFKHMSAVFRFDMRNIPAKARRLDITSTGNGIVSTFWPSFADDGDYITWAENHDNNTKTFNFTPNADGTFTFYLPFGCIGPWNNFTFTLFDGDGNPIREKTTTLGSYKDKTLEKNKMYVVGLDASMFSIISSGTGAFESAFGIDWSTVSASVAGDSEKSACRVMKAKLDASRLYVYLEVQSNALYDNASYLHANLTRLYIGDENSTSEYWTFNGHYTKCLEGWLKTANQYKYYTSQTTLVTANATESEGLAYYELAIPRSYDACLSGSLARLALEIYDVRDETSGWVGDWQQIGIAPARWTNMLEVQAD